jgi:protein gp37
VGDKSSIEWTDATWNPVTGCSKVSPGCAHCYAETQAMGRLKGRTGYPGLPWTPANAEVNVNLRPERLDQPSRWRKPRMVFVNSMSDLFHELVSFEFINEVWMQMYNNPRHTFQILTKRPERLRAWTRWAAREGCWPVDEIWPDWMWVGTSIEDRRYVARADVLRETPAAVRFISAEPLLGPLVYDQWNIPIDKGAPRRWDDHWVGPQLDLSGIHWLIVGGESGPGHRPMREEWVHELLREAKRADTAFFFKQWGGASPKAGGRELDGRTWDEMPERRTVFV